MRDELQSSYNEVTLAEHRTGEDVLLYAQRIADGSRLCRHLYQSSEKVNAYFLCLQEATPENYKSRSDAYHIKRSKYEHSAPTSGS